MDNAVPTFFPIIFYYLVFVIVSLFSYRWALSYFKYSILSNYLEMPDFISKLYNQYFMSSVLCKMHLDPGLLYDH